MTFTKIVSGGERVGKAPLGGPAQRAPEIGPDASFEGPGAARPSSFPVEPLVAAAGVTSLAALARRCGVGGSQMRLYRENGMSARVADRLAVRVGLHPAEVWSDWFEAVAS